MEITKNIHSVGVVDSDVRIFHGYQTPLGTTYNAYLVIDEKITLIDYVKASFAEEFLKNIKDVLGDRDIDYIICNHVEPDHSGALPLINEHYPKAKIYGTAACEKGLRAYYRGIDFEFCTVKLGDTLCTGEKTFSFVPMPMVHWPDSMATYLTNDKILFSNDAFGQHIGTGVVYDDDMTTEELVERCGNYYANIVLPFGMQVKKLAGAISDFKIELICPSHGVMLKSAIPLIVEKYIFWSEGRVVDKKLAIIYDSMWGTTTKMAKNLCREYLEMGFDVDVIDLSLVHYSEAMSRLLECSHIFVGSSTLNNCMLPTVSAFLCYMKGLKPKHRVGMAFGSYGWSGESIRDVEEILTGCGFEMLPQKKAQWNI